MTNKLKGRYATYFTGNKQVGLIELNFKWVVKRGQFVSGQNLKLNRIVVAGYFWNMARPQGTDKDLNWHGRIHLPSLVEEEVFAKAEEEIKTKIEQVVTNWFTEALK